MVLREIGLQLDTQQPVVLTGFFLITPDKTVPSGRQLWHRSATVQITGTSRV